MELIYAYHKKGQGFVKRKRVNVMVDYAVVCRYFDPESKGDEVLQYWVLEEVIGDKDLIRTCFSHSVGQSILELQPSIQLAQSIFQSWDDEKELGQLVRFSEAQGLDFKNVVFECWMGTITDMNYQELEAAFRDFVMTWGGNRSTTMTEKDIQEKHQTMMNCVYEFEGVYILIRKK